MKKTLIAASIAALAATSANAAVKIHESDTLTLSSYGKVQLELQNLDGENTIRSQGSRIGFKGEQELKHGLTGFFNAEFRYDAGQNVDSASFENRDTYLGVKGDFGSVKAGNFDSIVFTYVTSQADIFENKGYRSLDEGSNNARATAIAYETNDLNGLKIGVNLKHYASKDSEYGFIHEDKDVIEELKELGISPINSGLTSDNGKEQWNLQLGATYQLNDELSFGFAIDQNNKNGNPAAAPINGNAKPIIAARVNYATDQFGAGLVVEQTKDIIVTNLTGSYNYGAGDVYALVSFVDQGENADKFGTKDKNGVDFGLGANYKLADNFKVYGEVAVGNDDVSGIKKLDNSGDGTTAVTLGAAYKW